MNNRGGQVFIRILRILFGILLNSVIIHLILLSSVYYAVLIREYIAYLYFWTTHAITPTLYCTQTIGCRGFHWSEIVRVLIIVLLLGCSIVIINVHLILLFCITISRIRMDMNQFYRMMNN